MTLLWREEPARAQGGFDFPPDVHHHALIDVPPGRRETKVRFVPPNAGHRKIEKLREVFAAQVLLAVEHAGFSFAPIPRAKASHGSPLTPGGTQYPCQRVLESPATSVRFGP